MNTIKSDHLRGFTFQTSNAVDVSKLKSLNRSKSKDFGSLSLINENIDGKKSLRKRSSSTDNLLKTGTTNRADALEFKLPPILVPIIDNLTNNQSRGNSVISAKASSSVQDCSDSSSSDVESSESHQSLKSGLRKHLVKSNGRVPSVESDLQNGTDQALLVQNNKIFQDAHSFKQDLQTKARDFIDNARNSSTQEMEPEFMLKSITSRTKFDSMSKGSSLDSNKSLLGDSSSSSISSTDKSRVTSAQCKKVVYYRSNRAATARAKHKAIPIPSPPPNPLPPKEREQGKLFG